MSLSEEPKPNNNMKVTIKLELIKNTTYGFTYHCETGTLSRADFGADVILRAVKEALTTAGWITFDFSEHAVTSKFTKLNELTLEIVMNEADVDTWEWAEEVAA
jgi:hypothetical protein